MKLEYWKELHEHMKNKFNSLNKISELEEFPISCIKNNTKQTISLHNNLYKINCVSVSVNFKNIFLLNKKYTQQQRVLILSELNYCISKIMKLYNVQNINITPEQIVGSFQVKQKSDCNDLFECCAVINTFKEHINKLIKNYLFKNSYNEYDHYLNFGIGMWFGVNNYIYEIQNINHREILIVGESITYSNELSDKSRTNSMILFNELIYANMTDDYLKVMNSLIESTNLIIKNNNIYATNVILVKYLNWINNNIN